jgi:UbiD family decarboxylase
MEERESDLRSYLVGLEKEGLFRWLDREVDKDWEIGAVTRLLFSGVSEQNRFGIGFSTIRGYPGTRVVVGVVGGSKRILSRVLGVEPDAHQIHARWSESQTKPIPPKLVTSGPCKENIIEGADVNLLKLPAPVWSPGKDAGPYLTPLWITQDPSGQARNVGMYRAQVKGPDKLGIQWGRPDYQHAAQHLRAWEKIGKPMPAALVMGCEPSIYLAGVAKVPYGVDELAVAGNISKAPIEVIKCETSDLEVPASSEIVIEGEFMLGVTEPEGPFGEFTGYMTSSPRGEPVFKVKCITFRNEPILQGMLSQMPPSESSVCRQVMGEGAVWHHLTQELKMPGVVDVHLPESGGSAAALWISAKKPHQSFPLQLAMAVWSKFGFYHFKWIVVTDEDVNIRDAFAREWTLAFRVRPEKDIHVTPEVAAMTLDPSATTDPDLPSRDRTSGKLFIDATKKYARFPEIAIPAAKYLEQAAEKWKDYGLGPLDPNWKKVLV